MAKCANSYTILAVFTAMSYLPRICHAFFTASAYVRADCMCMRMGAPPGQTAPGGHSPHCSPAAHRAAQCPSTMHSVAQGANSRAVVVEVVPPHHTARPNSRAVAVEVVPPPLLSWPFPCALSREDSAHGLPACPSPSRQGLRHPCPLRQGLRHWRPNHGCDYLVASH